MQNELSNEFASFEQLLGASAPYQTTDLLLRFLLGGHFALDLGQYQRNLLEPTEQGPFNREFSRQFAVAQMFDLMLKGLSFSITSEAWEAGVRDYATSGYDLGYRFRLLGASGRLNIGSSFSIYKYDYYELLGERSEVRTNYLIAKVPVGAGLSLDGRYEKEIGEETYTTTRMGVRYDF